ncbi:hypothetical protein FACS1894125_2470 [Actinomycetota bacterium]|nr:hypothetical protein FACS1894125_2470 [Actinomycetota bacterium]
MPTFFNSIYNAARNTRKKKDQLTKHLNSEFESFFYDIGKKREKLAKESTQLKKENNNGNL